MVDKALRASLRRKTGIIQTRDRVRHVDDADKVGRVREAHRDWLMVMWDGAVTPQWIERSKLTHA